MRDILPDIEAWRRDGKRVAIATVAKVWGSAPRPLGSKMAISDAGEMAGSVSGGCVESAVYEEAQGVLSTRVPKLVHFGVSNEEAWAVGLSCGGKIDVYIESLEVEALAGSPVSPKPVVDVQIFDTLRRCLEDEQLVALTTVVSGPGFGQQALVWPDGRTRGALGSEALDAEAGERCTELFRNFANERRVVELDGERAEILFEIHPPRPKLIIVGAVHVSIPLVSFANKLGFRTIVVDPRTAFATPKRFPHVDELLTDWPEEALEKVGVNENTFLALLSHDLKLDIPALEFALARPARYIGALGSKKTHAKRLGSLRERGIDEAAIARIHNPIGLDLGGRRAEEIAVAVIAEMVAVSHGRGGK